VCRFRLLIAEDDEQDLTTCRDSVERFQHEKKRPIELVECRQASEAIEKLNGSFDGAIIDLKLDQGGDEGNQVIKRIVDSYFRIPVAIMTGTPGNADPQFKYIGVFKKGETSYTEILELFFRIHDTGLTRIMGGRGILEQTLNEVFLTNLLPQQEAWMAYGQTDPLATEKALLRFTLNHLMYLLDDPGLKCYPEEAYIYPPHSADLNTGSITKRKSNGLLYAVLNPACDLVVRGNGDFKTDRILIVEIEARQNIFDSLLSGITSQATKKKQLKTVLGNNYTDYFHWLPRTDFFEGGFINFRKISTVTKDEFGSQYQVPFIQISPPFVKDIVARFSSYYARQGQPDIECSRIINEIISVPEGSG